ncbi:MAG: aldo/keto reductase [Ignavibacteria bacterium]|nr:aldo/keto reductase [Ignavibacteria bacterium]
MIYRDFGKTGLRVSALGFGAGQIGSSDLSEQSVETLLGNILDEGINFIDTARGYGLSEHRIGKYLHNRRKSFILSTKVGYSIPGYQDWSAEIIPAGIEQALKLLQTDYIDIVFLHSCNTAILKNSGVAEALTIAKEKGKVRFIGYSGENEDLDYALSMRCFDVIQCSINIFDQKNIVYAAARARQTGLGIIAKRPLGNCPWQFTTQPYGQYAEEYWKRMKAMNLDLGTSWPSIALRFSAFHGNADTIITGSSKIEHIRQNISLLQQGPLDAHSAEKLINLFQIKQNNWNSQI